MYKLFILLCCFFPLITTTAQETASISGRIFDSKTGEVLPYTSVAIKAKPTGELLSGAVTNNEGRFEILGLSPGEYIIQISFVGYETYQEEILVGELNTIFDLGKIEINPEIEQLDEATVTAQKSEISADMEMKTYDLSDNIAQSGGSVMDAMKTMPGVTVSQEGKIILRGSDKVIVLIDGKQSSLTGFGNQKGLDNIPAANIDKIEIINNPSAKYDAAGMAGIINIVYKKEKETGLNGEIGFTYGLGAIGKAKKDVPSELGSYTSNPKYIPNLNLNYKTKKLNFFLLSEAMYLNGLPNNEFTTRYYDDGRITASQVPENRTQQHYILNGGIDYSIDDNNILTLSGIFDWEKHNDTAQVPYINELTSSRYRYINWHEEEITGYMNYALNYEHKFPQPGHVLEASAQYTKGWEDETYHINDSSSLRQGRDVTSILATEHTTSLQVDYTKPMASGRIEAGSKLQVRRLPVDFTVQRGENSVIYPGLGDWSKWGENIYAGYINYVYEKPLYDIEAGLRAEQTEVFYDIDPDNIYYDKNDAYNYFELFPNVRLSFKFNSNNKISVFYNRRVDRPGEPELRIFTKSDDQELLKSGNPYLRPQFTQSVEAAYRLKWHLGSFFLAGYHRIINDPFMRVYTIDSTNPLYEVITKTYANTGSATNTGIEIVFSQQITKFWKLSVNTNIYKNNIDAFQGSLLFPFEHTFQFEESSDNTWDLKVNNQFKLNNNTSIQLTGIYLAPKNIPQGNQKARSSVDFGIKKVIMKGKGEVNLSATDIFNKYGIKQEIIGDGFKAIYENYYETQVFRMGLKYKF